MRLPVTRILFVAGVGLWLAGCNTTSEQAGKTAATQSAAATLPPPDITGSISSARAKATDDDAPDAAKSPEIATKPPEPKIMVLPGDEPETIGDPADAIALGREQYRLNKFREAERHFRRATQLQPRNSEAWLGIAACFDRLRNFSEADRAYDRAIAITGPTSEVLNNQGYSYMLRGDHKRAREKLLAAQRQDPLNKYVANNLQLLDSNERKGGSR